MALLKLPFILAAAIGMQVTFTNPNQPPSQGEQVATTSERVLKVIIKTAALILKGGCWITTLAEAATIIAVQVPASPTSRWVLSTLVIEGSSGASHVAITYACICGALLVTFGAFLRFQCYQSLGKFFTFELSIHKDHALITTGPYSIVRHPSYTGAILVLTGTFVVHVTRGSWLRECGGWESGVGKVFTFFWVAAALSSVSGVVLRRIPGEDAAMKKQFGKVWDEWAHRVRYRLIPGVY